MKIIYDSETDSLTFLFRDAQIYLSEEPRPGVIVDFDTQNRAVSCEILNASSQVEAPDCAPHFIRRERGNRSVPDRSWETSGSFRVSLVSCPVKIRHAVPGRARLRSGPLDISIEGFVKTEEVDPVFFEEPFLVDPDGPVAEETFWVLLHAMSEEGVSGLAMIDLEGEKRRALIYPGKGAFSLVVLRDHTRLASNLHASSDAFRPDQEMIGLARELIAQKTTAFSSKHTQPLAQRRLAASKEGAITQGARSGKVIDLRRQLERSVGRKRLQSESS